MFDRISVRRGSSLVPLMPGIAAHAPSPSAALLGERHRFNGAEIPEHEHEHFCLHLQTQGGPALEWWWEGRHGIEHPGIGALILLPPGTRDHLRWHGVSERYIVSLDARSVSAVANDLGYRGTPEFRTRWQFYDPALQLILAEIGREISAGWPLGGIYADLLGIRLAEALLRRQAVRPPTVGSISGGIPWKLLRMCLEFMHDNLDRDIRLLDIARVAGLSEFHFARLFRKSTRQTPHQYLLDQRIARAKHLLSTTGLSIEQIGVASGFPRAASFSRSFAFREGVSPRAWRKEFTGTFHASRSLSIP